MKPGQKIDFFNIDVEGFELEVLESNDWTKYRPTLIITEILNSDEENNHVFKYLESKGYKFYGKAVYSFYFIDSLDKES